MTIENRPVPTYICHIKDNEDIRKFIILQKELKGELGKAYIPPNDYLDDMRFVINDTHNLFLSDITIRLSNPDKFGLANAIKEKCKIKDECFVCLQYQSFITQPERLEVFVMDYPTLQKINKQIGVSMFHGTIII